MFYFLKQYSSTMLQKEDQTNKKYIACFQAKKMLHDCWISYVS